ncbi:aminopeptidase P family protein [Dactylosporangium salmoneum]|uniref:Xaa-Pro aminopeptidase n=1 Tax=Dactylosporangium salmoneum TaxID=53361 RepID=A0ABN3GK54_9ACTN
MGAADNGADGAPAGSQSHDPDFPERFREFMRTGWRDAGLDVTPRAEAPDHAKRRAELSAAFPGETLIIPSGAERVRSNDTNHSFRPGTEHVWLSGSHEPDSVLVVRPSGDATLYVHPRSPRDTDEFFTDRNNGELWVGRRHTLAERATELQITTAHIDELGAALDDCAPGRTRVLRGFDPAVDERVRATDPQRDADLAAILSELRLVKDAWELEQLQDAVDATVRGFEDAARALPADRPVRERLIEGLFWLRARHDGNDVGYSSIVGAGVHGTILHWTRNDGETRPGELLLLDMGVENRNFYTADVTRTLPVSGTFTPLQRQVYDLVHHSQQAGIDTIRPGVAFDDVHQACMRVLAEGLSDLGILPVTVDEAMKPDSILYRRWTLHGFGHMLGLDVHDCARSRKEKYREGSLEAGYVLTVEPGLYFQPEDELVPQELRGLAVRIEDDVLVTPTGARNLSDGLPRAADDVESWLAARREEEYRLPQ